MALPSEFNTGTVKGKILQFDGTPAAGTITFEPRIRRLVVSAAETVITPQKVVALLDGTGAFSQVLPATDDPDVAPVNFTYKVTENLDNGLGSSYDLAVPAGSTVDISSILSGVPASGGAVIAKGDPGEAGSTGPPGPALIPKDSVANAAALPGSGNTVGDLRITLDDGKGYAWDGSAWIDLGIMRGPEGDTGPALGGAGTIASRDAASAVDAGYIYYATDEGKSYIKQGALGGGSWILFADPPGTGEALLDELPVLTSSSGVRVDDSTAGLLKLHRLVHHASGSSPITNTTVETAFTTLPITIPANELNAHSLLNFKGGIVLKNNTGASQTTTLRLKADGTLIASLAIVMATPANVQLPCSIDLRFRMAMFGAPNDMLVFANAFDSYSLTTVAGAPVRVPWVLNTLASLVDVSSETALTFTAQHSVANAQLTAAGEEMYCELIQTKAVT